MKHRVLILTLGAYPNLNANSKIAYEIGEGLKKYYDCDVTMISLCNERIELSIKNPYDIDMVKFDSMIRYHEVMSIRNRKIRKLIKFIFTPRTAWIFFRYKRSGLEKVLTDEYCYYVRKELHKRHYDCLIGFYGPEIIADVLFTMRNDIRTLFYMLDPWSTRFLESEQIEKIKKKDIMYITQFDSVYCSRLIYNDYKNIMNIDKTVLGKFVIAGYPNICKPYYSKRIQREKNYPNDEQINCVFCGKLYKDIRSSKYALSLFDLLKNDNVILHIFGYLDVDKKDLPQNVIFHGNVPQDELDLYIDSADFLVNIGNNVSNRMPSKILTYISTGKPILNFIKIKNCPTLDYISRYELSCNIFEKDYVNINDVEQVRAFLHSEKGKMIPFNIIEREFYECTPRYVCGQVYETISKY